MLLYVDDIIINGDDIQGIIKLKQFLNTQFKMKDLDRLSYFLGLEVSPNGYNCYLSQVKYTTDLLSRVDLTDNKTINTPLKANVKLSPIEGTVLDNLTLYRQLVGSLIYLIVTQPNIVNVIHIVSQFVVNSCSSNYSLFSCTSYPLIHQKYLVSRPSLFCQVLTCITCIFIC